MKKLVAMDMSTKTAMTQRKHPLHVSGSQITPDISSDVGAASTLQSLKQDLLACRADNEKLSNQLTCLVSLIKRSWSGDRHATFHLSNIVGCEPPHQSSHSDGTQGRPNSQAYTKTKSEYNWERLTIKLLEREYLVVQKEIHDYQRRYIENRQAYMDAVLQDHQQSISRIPLHRNTDPSLAMAEVDLKFINHTKALKKMGVSKRRYARPQSGVSQRRVQDTIENMGLYVQDLVAETPSSNHFISGQAPPHARVFAPSANNLEITGNNTRQYRPPNSYNDPARYAEKSLFCLNHTDPVQKPRPVSASSLRERDIIRARPRSGHTVPADATRNFTSEKPGRPLKYETTRPVSGTLKSSKLRRNSLGRDAKTTGGPQSRSDQDTHDSNSKLAPKLSGWERSDALRDTSEDYYGTSKGLHDPTADQEGAENDVDPVTFDTKGAKPPLAVRIQSAPVRRPAFIDEFASEEQAMKEMENDFRRTALSFQKKLGIESNGMVTFQ